VAELQVAPLARRFGGEQHVDVVFEQLDGAILFPPAETPVVLGGRDAAAAANSTR